MFFNILFLNIFLLSFSYASFQNISIGTIDSYYKNKISKTELLNILTEIENTFESQLSMNVFDYSKNGKPIDILYVPASKLEKRMKKKQVDVKFNIAKIKKIQNSLPSKLEKIDIMKKDFKIMNKALNQEVRTLNAYVSKVNKQKEFSKGELDKIKSYIKIEKKKIKITSSKLKNHERKLQVKINAYNKEVALQKYLYKKINRLNHDIERLSRNFKIVKGNAISVKETILKTFYKNGKKIREKSEKIIMNKIEIYGFHSRNELKAVLAHEIAHLLGIPHLDVKNALMNPVLQQNQITKLRLTQSDIINFKKNF